MAPSAPSTASISVHSQNSSARKKRWASPGANTEPNHHDRETKTAEPAASDLQNLSSAHVIKPTNACEGHHAHGLASLSNLPYEILYTIASQLRTSKSIFDFALVNRQINRIVEQALVKEAIIPKNHIRSFLEMLLTRQDLIKTVKAVDLGDYVCGHPSRCLCVGRPHFDAAHLKVLNKAIEANTGKAVKLSDIRRHMRRPGPLWRKNHSFFLYVLLSLCPNLTSVAFELPETHSFDSSRPPISQNLAPSELPVINEELLPVTPFHGPMLGIMQRRLEVLIIREDSRWKGPLKREVLSTPQDVFWRNMGKFTITLPGFVNLKRLDIPMDVLGRPESIVFINPANTNVEIAEPTAEKNNSANDNDKDSATKPSPRLVKELPFTLQHLHLRSCNQWTFSFLQRINEVPSEQLKLKQIELFFKSCPRSSISLCYAEDGGKLDYPRILSELGTKGVKLSFFAGKMETPFNMQKELAALSALSPLEVWLFALSNIWYSELNEAASQKRRQSMTASHLFMKHAHDYLPLMNTPTFNGKAWARIAFFHGFKNTKWDRRVLPETSKAHEVDPELWSKRALGRRDPKRRLPFLLDLNNSSFEIRMEQNFALCPPQVLFLNQTFSFEPKALLSQKAKSHCNRTMSKSENNEQVLQNYRQGHWIDRVEQSKRKGEKRSRSLEQEMMQLKLTDDCMFKNHPPEVLFTNNSKFQGELWTGVNWKSHFCNHNVSERENLH